MNLTQHCFTWILVLGCSLPAWGQTLVRLQPTNNSGSTINSSGDSTTLTSQSVGGFGSAKVQTIDSYSGTWEVQCSLDNTNFDTDNELKLLAADSSTVVYSVTDEVGIWDVLNAGGCRSIRVMAIAGFSGSDTVVWISGTQAGSGSGAGAASGGEVTNTGTFTVQENGAALTALQLIDNAVSGAGLNVTQLGGVNVSMNAGVNGTGVVRTTIATDDEVNNGISSIDANITTLVSNQGVDATHGNSVPATGPLITAEAKDIDGSALPNVVTEGQAIRTAATLSGALLTTPVHEDGLSSPIANEDVASASGEAGMKVLSVRRDVAATSAGTTADQATLNTDALGQLWTRQLDPCSGVAKSFHIVNMATATTVEIANAVASEFWYICSVNLVAAAAQTIAIGHDDTDGCGSITAGLHGGATAATGWSFAANGVITLGNGSSTVMKSATANHYLCVITGQAQQISGTISYVSAP